ncbi:MAG: hypothetical protein KDI38_09395 [Calditrichaeota bacterium]|nr:hypothetical protein [Calditrichota bacterium]
MFAVQNEREGVRMSMIEIENWPEVLEEIQENREVFLSWAELADRFGLAETTLRRMAIGETTKTRKSTIRKIAKALNSDFEIDGNKIRFLPKNGLAKATAERLPPDVQKLVGELDRFSPEARKEVVAWLLAVLKAKE